jgi:tetratricopeptide (TPR) repeat protein
MYRVIFFIAVLASVPSVTNAQDPVDFNTINNETYRLYLSQDWDSVIILGKIALKQDVDYYYLRMRMGISLYSQKKYRQAAGHFKKAMVFNHEDPLAQEYLYYSLLFSGQYEQAILVRKQFKGDLALKLTPSKGKAIDRIRGEYLYNRGLNDDLLSDPDPLFSGLPPGVQYITRTYSNASLSLSHSITPGFRMNHAYSYLSKTNHFYYNDGLNSFQVDDQHVYQHQYYLSPVVTLRSGFELMPMFHLVGVHYQTLVDAGLGFQGGNAVFELVYMDELDYVTGLGFSKGIGTLDLNLGIWYATLNKTEQVQNRLGLTWYPLGNLNLYTGGYLNSQYEISDTGNVIRPIPELLVGYAIAGKVWLELNVAMGEMTNYLQQNGSIVYNSFSDVIHKKVTLTVTVPVAEKGSLLYLGGRWTANESQFYAVDPAQNEITNSITYNALSIYGGISWKF